MWGFSFLDSSFVKFSLAKFNHFNAGDVNKEKAVADVHNTGILRKLVCLKLL